MALERVRSPHDHCLLPYYGGPLQANLSLAGRHFPGLRLSTAISGWNSSLRGVALALQTRPDLELNPENPKVLRNKIASNNCEQRKNTSSMPSSSLLIGPKQPWPSLPGRKYTASTMAVHSFAKSSALKSIDSSQ
jgi:hypothetical protein